MKKALVTGSLLIVLSLVLIPLSAAMAPVESPEVVLDSFALDVLPVQVQVQIKTVVSQDPAMAQAVAHQLPTAVVQAATFLQANNGSNRTILRWIWSKILNYRVDRFLISLVIYANFRHTKFFEWRTLTWAIKVLKWVRVGMLLGFVSPVPLTPNIDFVADTVNRTITVNATDPGVAWSYIGQMGNGTCSSLPTGNVTVGQMITNCSGSIILVYIPRGDALFTADFPE